MTKIDIFSGFLGAGKTTLIKKLLQEAYAGEKLVLIENEFGEIGIDGGFMQDAGIEVTEMNSGCICCSLVGDFGKALRKVLDEYHPDRILIEPSGVGKLSDIIRAVQGVATEDVILKRLERTREEVPLVDQYDYVVYNRDGGVEQCVEDIRSIALAEQAEAAERNETVKAFRTSQNPDAAKAYFAV